MIKVAAHQPNFCPWLPFFYKMAMVDKFIILTNVQFEKNGFQNRYKKSDGSWVTKPVSSGIESIFTKKYSDGKQLSFLNYRWIEVIKETLGIETEIVFDNPDGLYATDHLISSIKTHGGDVYVTNPEAKAKYLDEDKMNAEGIDIEYCVVPRNYRIHIFDAFNQYGIEHLSKMLSKVKTTKRGGHEVAVATV